MKKNVIGVIVCLALSVLFVYAYPQLIKGESELSSDQKSGGQVEQYVLGYSETAHTYHKIYNSGQLIGIISDKDRFYAYIDEEYMNYADKFPNSSLGLSDDLYIVEETSFADIEDKDREIVDYLIEKELLGVRTNAIEFSTSSGVFDIIYVNSIDDFYTARDQFLLNFISEETLETLQNNETIGDPDDFGTIETGIRIQESISIQEAFSTPDEIFTSVNEIYNYLCYGRETQRQYYTTVEGDTLQGVGYRFQNMSPKQIMMLNPDIILSEDQMLTAGMKLNVTYFSSPLTVYVTKERLTQEVINPENPIYITDTNLAAGVTRIDVEEINGLENVLYEETWVNGVLQSGYEKSSVVVREPIQGVITVGAQKQVDYGTGNYIWPVDNPHITCLWGCYYGHTGTDIVNAYNPYGPIYAADTGVVVIASYHYINGNYVVIDHQNGYQTYYGHMSAMYVQVGDVVQRGDVIGQIGATGLATGPHVHFHFIVDGTITNACNFMDCNSIPWS